MRVPAGGARQGQPDVHVHVRDDAYDYGDYGYQRGSAYQEPARRRRGLGCLTALAALLAFAIVAVIALIVATNLFVKPRIEEAVADNVGGGIETAVSEQFGAGIGELPSGEITITEDEINQRIDGQGSLGPLNDLNVGITPDGLEADLDAYGLNGSYEADVSVENGEIQLSNSSISGPLQYLIPKGEIEQVATNAINRSLAESGYRVEGVTLQDGALVLALAR